MKPIDPKKLRTLTENVADAEATLLEAIKHKRVAEELVDRATRSYARASAELLDYVPDSAEVVRG